MKGHYLIKDQKGAAIVIIVLIILPLLVITNVYFNENKRLLTGSNATLKNTVALAAKAAAQSVDSKSQASGKPVINPEFAHNNFRKILAKNLKLNDDFKSGKTSPVANEVNYYLLICNGFNDCGISEGVIYSYQNGSLTETILSLGNLPKTFGINSDFEILPDGKTVTFDKPGVIAIVDAEIKSIAMHSGARATRWAAARIVY